MTSHAAGKTLAVPLTEEVATVSKHSVETERVTVRTITELHEDVVREELASENVDVTRVPIGRVVDTLPDLRTEGDVTIIPVLEERLVVTKELVLVEEIHIQRQRTSEQVEIPLTLRRQAVQIDQEDERERTPEP